MKGKECKGGKKSGGGKKGGLPPEFLKPKKKKGK